MQVNEPARSELLGLPFDPSTMQAAVDQCLGWCEAPRCPHTVITANAAILCMMRRDPALKDACTKGDLIVADGASVVWVSRLAGVRLPVRVAGVDLMDNLLRTGAARGLSVYFLGARPEVVKGLVDRCARDYPGLKIAGYQDGYFKPGEQAAVIEHIRASAPHMLFVGMPSPFKETFCEQNRDRLGVPVIMGVGGSFDVLAGWVRRAPRRLQLMGLEWAWRLLMEPRKLWKRYLTTNGEFLWLAGKEILALRLRPPGRAA